jgi:ABC-type transport system involved in multi-copper enzyme maturation permease subunit
MTAALRYEWARLRTLRSTWWLSLGSLLVGVGFTFVASWVIRANVSVDELNGGKLDGDMARFYVDAAMTQFSNVDPMFYLLGFVAAIIGVLAWGHEYRHGMIRATLTAVPNRAAIFSAKYIVVGAWVAGLVVISCLLSLFVSGIFFLGLDIEYNVKALAITVFTHVVYSVLLVWLAMSATALVRHQTFSLVLLFLWPMGIETLIKGFARILAVLADNDAFSHATRFLPFNAGGRIMQNFGTTPGSGFGLQDNLDLFGDPLSAWGGFIVFGGFVALVTAGALASFIKRDA